MLAALAGLAVVFWPASDAQTIRPFSDAAGDAPPPPWHVHGFPSGNKPVTEFSMVTLDGQRVLRVATDKSYGTLRHDLPALTLSPGTLLRWRWRLDQPVRDADLRRKNGDDTPIKICALFDLDPQRLGFVERSFLLATRRIANQYIPAETLCYVWDQRLPAGTELPNAFTRRVRYVVLDSGDSQLKTWVSHERDLVTDFRRAFGDETDTVPPLIGLLIGADADNTASSSLAFVGNLELKLPSR
jgi:hypothetical protein